MLNNVTQYFLEEYFLIESILDDNANKKIFTALADIFGLEKKDADKLFAVTENEKVKDIKTNGDYKRYLRIKQYLSREEEEDLLSETISIKGQSLEYAAKFDLNAKEGMNALSIQSKVMQKAASGQVAAMRCLGLTSYLGIFFEKNAEMGLEVLRKAAEWSDIRSILILLNYDEEGRSARLSELSAATSFTPYDRLPSLMAKKYSIKATAKNENIELLKDAFNQQKAEPDTFNPIFNRILQSKAISLDDKRKILLSGNNQLIAQTADLPLKISFSDLEYRRPDAVFERADENRKINAVLKNCDLRASSVFKPLCLTAEDEYLCSAYLKAIKAAFPTAHSEIVNVGDLSEQDLDNTSENALLRSLSEKSGNVIFLLMRGELSQFTVEKIADFIRSSFRKKYHLRAPAVTMDLSSVLPVCICDRENAEKLDVIVDQVKIADLTDAEKPQAIRDKFKRKCKKALVSSYSIEDKVVFALAEKGMDAASKILDEAIKELRTDKLCLNESNMKKYFDEYEGDRKGYGFGGKIK